MKLNDNYNYKFDESDTYLDKQLFAKTSITMIFLFALGFSFGDGLPTYARLFLAYLFAGIPFGWSVLNEIKPNIFLFMSFVGWIIYFVVKIALSMFIGMFIIPYKIVRGLLKVRNMHN
jgi:hypothetical protein